MQTVKFILLSICFIFSSQISAQKYLNGYDETIKGEIITYHAPQPDADRAMLIRSEDSTRYIEWKTEKIPIDYKEKKARFLMLAGIDVNSENPHKWNVSIDGRACFTISSPLNAESKTILWQSQNGCQLEFIVQSVDRHGDYMGYLILEVPADEFKGKDLTIKVTGESAKSPTWFMVFEYKTERKVKLVAEPAIMKGKKENYQAMRLDITHFDNPVDALILIGNRKIKKLLNFGFNRLYFEVPVISEAKDENVQIKVGNQLIANENFSLKPVAEKTIYLIHHSHVDIGYTHVQKEVEELQWSFLESALELAGLSKEFPNEARFKWNVEVMWAIDSYLEKASPEKRKSLIEAVKNGWIELDALYANELTALCSTRELIELTESSRRVATECGVEAESAMISDVPGWTWGMAPVLANSGVKYLSMGTNQGHRIGSMIEKWGDKPFYWVSQSGQEKVLCWIHQMGYSFFHTGLGYQNLQKVLKEDKIFSYLNQANESDYPYDILILRYNIGSDNGPTDKTLPETVKEWNEKYISPKLVISSVSEAFSIFEKKYGHEIPAVTGDLTGYWEDGAMSSAKETGINRRNAAKLNQIETLLALLNPSAFNHQDISRLWKKIMLYDEHTWGSWNSISEPEADFTRQQWKIKQAFAIDAEKESDKMLVDIMKTRSNGKNISSVEVFNTLSWKRDGLVFLTTDSKINSVIDSDGNKFPVQKLSDSTAVFIAENVPAFGSKNYSLKEETIPYTKTATFANNRLTSDNVSVSIDENSGAISQLIFGGKNFVDNAKLKGLNQYFYVKGRNPLNILGIDKVKIKLKEDGPVISSILVESSAPGCESLSREIQLIKPLGIIKIINTIDKQNIYDQEGLHFAFPFNIPDGQMRYDLAFSVARPDADQLQGSCKNYLTLENYLDISNQDYGVTVALIDAPLFEIGDITTDAPAYGWIESLKKSQTFYSYVMNNYWETNYCASQQGKTIFTYLIKPHERFDGLAAEKFGNEQMHMLIPVLNSDKSHCPEFELVDNGIIAVNLKPVNDGTGLLMTLYNPSGKPEDLEWVKKPKIIFESNFDGDKLKPVTDEMIIPAFGLTNLYISVK